MNKLFGLRKLSSEVNWNQPFQRAFSSSISEIIGFIGLGNMGSGMAANLSKNGYEVLAFDVVKENCQNFRVAKSISEIGERASKIITMLPNNQIVSSVYEELSNYIQPNCFCIDSSTVDPSVSQKLFTLIRDKGGSFVDAPVSGGVNAALSGSLVFMVGASHSNDFETAKSLLSSMGSKITYCGDVGNGQAVKICNNMLLAISMIGVAETMNLGENLGLSPKFLASILGTASGRCWSLDTYNPVPGVQENVPASRNYEGGFGTDLMLKDIRMSQEIAIRTGSTTPLGSLSHQLYQMLSESGRGHQDFSVIYQFLKNKK